MFIDVKSTLVIVSLKKFTTKTVNEENMVIFYPTTSVKDTIDGIWVSGLPDKVNLIVTGQEYVAIGESVSN